MGHLIKVLTICLLISCGETHELIVELDQDLTGNTPEQVYHFNYNGTITFPSTGFTKEIDLENDRIEIIKIKYQQIQKWNVIGPKSPETNNSWGQQAILVRILRKNPIFVPNEIIFEQKISHFYNPTILSISSGQADQIRSITKNLDSGLGNGESDNNKEYLNLPPQLRLLFSNDANNYYHTVVDKFSAVIDQRSHYNPRTSSAADLFNVVNIYNLPTVKLSQAAIIFPFDTIRYKELENFPNNF